MSQIVCPNQPLEKAMAPHSSTLAWKIPWMEEPGGLQSMGSLGVGHDSVTSLSCVGEGNGNSLQCSCRGWGSLVGCCLWGQSRTQLKRLSRSNSNQALLSCSKSPLEHAVRNCQKRKRSASSRFACCAPLWHSTHMALPADVQALEPVQGRKKCQQLSFTTW